MKGGKSKNIRFLVGLGAKSQSPLYLEKGGVPRGAARCGGGNYCATVSAGRAPGESASVATA